MINKPSIPKDSGRSEMTEKIKDPGDPGRPARIERAVEKETRRRKRLLILYGLFLSIPIAVGVGFLIYGQSGREVSNIDVDRRLASVEKTVEQTEPALQKVRDVAAQVSAQEEQLGRLRKEQTAFLENARQLYARVSPDRQFEKELDDLRNRLTRQDNILATLDDRFNRQSKLLAALQDNQNKILIEHARIASEVKSLADRVSTVRPTRYDEVLQEHTKLLEQVQKELRSLTKREADGQSHR